MKLFGKSYVAVFLQQLVYVTFGIFRRSELVGNVYVPMCKLRVECLNPFGNTGFARVDFLPATNQTNYYCPIFALVE